MKTSFYIEECKERKTNIALNVASVLSNFLTVENEDDVAELNVVSNKIAEKVFSVYGGLMEPTLNRIRLEAMKFISDVWGEDKSWKEDFFRLFGKKQHCSIEAGVYTD